MLSEEAEPPVSPTPTTAADDGGRRAAGFGLLERAARFQRIMLAAANPPPEVRTILRASIDALERRADRHLASVPLSVRAVLSAAADLARFVVEGDGLPEPPNPADVAIAWANHEVLLSFAARQPNGDLAVEMYREKAMTLAAKERAERVSNGDAAQPALPLAARPARQDTHPGVPVSSLPVAPDVAPKAPDPKPADAVSAKEIDPPPPLDLAPFRVEPSMRGDSFHFGGLAETPRPPPPFASEPPENPPAPAGNPGAVPAGQDKAPG